MDSAFYTLIGALGGILITQVANYFLEDKKSKNTIALKSLEFEHQTKTELLKERRIAYSKYLDSLDQYYGKKVDTLADIVGSYYCAVLISSPITTNKIRTVFNHIKESDFDVDEYLAAKKTLMDSMQDDLQT